MPPLQESDVPSNSRYMFMMITPFFLIICHSRRCFQTSIYSLQNFSDILLILPLLEFLQIFHHHYHGDCRILADGMRIFNLECCYHFTTVLGRRPQSNHPWHSLRMHLYDLLLDTHQSHTMPTIGRCLLWTFCYCTKCSFHPTVIISR